MYSAMHSVADPGGAIGGHGPPPPPNDGQIVCHSLLYQSLIDFLNNETHKTA